MFKPSAFFAKPDGFYRDRATNDRIHGLVHNTHSAAAHFADDLVSSGFCYRCHLRAGACWRPAPHKFPEFARADRTPSGLRVYAAGPWYFLSPDVLLVDTSPRAPGRPTLHSTHRNFYRSTLLGYQCFSLDTCWLFCREGNQIHRSLSVHGTKSIGLP